MNKAYVDINWENYPSENTPLNEDNLNKMVSAINLNGENIQSLDVSKATIEEVNPLVKDVTRDENTGIVTVTKKDGSTSKFGTGLDTSKQLHLSLYNSDYDPTLEPSSSYFIDKVATLVAGDKNYQHLCAATADESGSVWLQSVDGPAYTRGPKGGDLDLNPLGGDVRVNKSAVLTAANWSNYISVSGGTDTNTKLYFGTIFNHTSGTGSSSPFDALNPSAAVDDLYINTNYGYVYTCTASKTSTTKSVWKYTARLQFDHRRLFPSATGLIGDTPLIGLYDDGASVDNLKSQMWHGTGYINALVYSGSFHIVAGGASNKNELDIDLEDSNAFNDIAYSPTGITPIRGITVIFAVTTSVYGAYDFGEQEACYIAQWAFPDATDFTLDVWSEVGSVFYKTWISSPKPPEVIKVDGIKLWLDTSNGYHIKIAGVNTGYGLDITSGSKTSGQSSDSVEIK